MPIYINGRFLTKKLTGIQRYAMEVLKELDKIETDEKIILLQPKEILYDLNLKNIEIKKIGHLTDNLWEQISVPLYLFGKKNVKLLNLFNSAPILYPGYVTLHDIAFKTHPGHLTKKFVMWYSFMTRLNIKRYKHIFTVTEFAKKEICDVYHIDKNKITVTYNSAEHLKGIEEDDSIIKELKLENKVFCFSLGSRSQHKNHKYIEECAKRNPDITFVISGGINNLVLKNEKMDDLKNMIYTGYITDNQLVALYRHCSCFIFPSLYEGFGIPPLEAITVGCKKVLLSNLDVFKEVYGDSVEYFDLNGNEDKYNIKAILEDGKEVDYKIVEKYSWKKIAKKIMEKVEEKNE